MQEDLFLEFKKIRIILIFGLMFVFIFLGLIYLKLYLNFK